MRALDQLARPREIFGVIGEREPRHSGPPDRPGRALTTRSIRAGRRGTQPLFFVDATRSRSASPRCPDIPPGPVPAPRTPAAARSTRAYIVARAVKISGARCGSSSIRRSSSSSAALRRAVLVQQGRGAQQRRHDVVAVLHLRVQAQRLLRIAVAIRDQRQIIRSIVQEICRCSASCVKSRRRRVEVPLLKFQQPQQPQRHGGATPGCAPESPAARWPPAIRCAVISSSRVVEAIGRRVVALELRLRCASGSSTSPAMMRARSSVCCQLACAPSASASLPARRCRQRQRAARSYAPPPPDRPRAGRRIPASAAPTAEARKVRRQPIGELARAEHIFIGSPRSVSTCGEFRVRCRAANSTARRGNEPRLHRS